MLKRFLFLVLLAALSAGWTGCATQEQADDPNRVSTIPWNRPERWEGQGPLGSFAPQNYR